MHDRLIQLVALIVLAGGVVGAFLLTPAINHQRVERKLTYDIEVGDNANPAYALGEALGSFRGVAVNILWQRAEELKREGKFFEANNLAEMITTLQPRYPEAWNFHGWNMAYNISVKCKTAEERWDWVQKGMALIRDRGIPNNPDAVVLYRSLGWILGHKMGGNTDDMQWYYKQRWVDTWQTLLGEPPAGWMLKPQYTGENRPKQEDIDPLKHGTWLATERMRAVSAMADRYLLRPGRVDLDQVRAPALLGIQAQAGAGSTRDNEDADDDPRDYNASNYFEALGPDALDRFYTSYPDLAAVVNELQQLTGPDGEELGLGLNIKTLRAIGRIMLYRDAGYWTQSDKVISNETVGVEGVAVKEWLDSQAENRVFILNPYNDPEAVRAQLKERGDKRQVVNLMPMLDLLRAQAIIADYHMDPAYMLACMERFGPLDWRHPSAHAVYWTALGTLRAKDNTIHLERIDFINANRSTIHALQNLAHYGTISYRPEVEALGAYGVPRINYSSDTRMIPAYERAVEQTREFFESGVIENHDTSTYERGHENFLQTAVVLYYFEGNEAKAREYFDKVRELYADSEDSPDAVAGEYKLQLADFARVRLGDDLPYQGVELINYYARMAWRQGVASRDPGEMRRYLQAAKATYDKYLEDRQTTSRNDSSVQARQGLPPFGEMVLIQFLEMMADPGFTLPQKAMIWRQGAPMLVGLESEQPLLLVAYMEMRPMIRQQAQTEGYTGDLIGMFPEPRGFREWAQRVFEQQGQRQPSP